MRVLQVNKFYRRGAGAESVLFETMRLLEGNGHEVAVFATRDPRNEPSPWEPFFAPRRDYTGGSRVRRVADAASVIYSTEARKSLRRLITAFRPDVAHLHNVYHQLTLAVVDELRSARIPTVMTLHDYKPACPN
jgi:hypothetical protein